MDAANQMDFYTIEDIDNLPKGQRAELLDGELYLVASPGTNHQETVSELHYQIKDYIKKMHGNCKVYTAPFAVFQNADNSIYLEPDISVICDRNKITQKGCNGAPDWVIEAVSPSSRSMDYSKKLFLYRTAGVLEYWIADSDKNRILVYDFVHDTANEYTFSDKVKSGIFDCLEIDFSRIDFE